MEGARESETGGARGGDEAADNHEIRADQDERVFVRDARRVRACVSRRAVEPSSRTTDGMDDATTSRRKEAVRSPMIPGLRYVPAYLDAATHDELLAAAAAGPWRKFFGSRRMQIYGYSYDLRKGGVYRVEDLPAWAQEMAARLQRDGLMPELPDQLIVNEYPAGEGIDAHIDAPLFTDTIVSISLGSSCIMEFMTESGDR